MAQKHFVMPAVCAGLRRKRRGTPACKTVPAKQLALLDNVISILQIREGRPWEILLKFFPRPLFFL